MILSTLTIVFVITLLIGVPIVFCLGISSLAALLVMGDMPLQIIPQKIYNGMDSFPLLCIPFFILAGEFMGQGKITDRLLKFSILLVGRMRGGLALANVLASMFFGGMTGSALADTSALGSVEIPMMIKAGYGKRFSAAITCASAIVGPLIPPSVVVIIYALAVGGSIGALFLAGVIPGILVGLALMVGAYIISRKRNYPKREEKVSLKELYYGFKKVFLALMLPVIIVGGIISGLFTATEASSIAVVYAFIVTVFIMKTIKFSQIPKLMVNSVIVTAIVMIILGTSTIFGWVITVEQVNVILAKFLGFAGPIVFLLIINIFLLFLGAIMDIIPVILIFAPTLAPIAIGLGIHPLHFGMIVCLNCTIGLITPPLGQVLFIGCSIADISLEALSKEILVFLFIELAVLFLVTYVPFTTLWVPRLFGFIS
jgi:tripartite ATP-independent transporter DctM subunit